MDWEVCGFCGKDIQEVNDYDIWADSDGNTVCGMNGGSDRHIPAPSLEDVQQLREGDR